MFFVCKIIPILLTVFWNSLCVIFLLCEGSKRETGTGNGTARAHCTTDASLARVDDPTKGYIYWLQYPLLILLLFLP